MIAELGIVGFRSVREATLRPRAMCALVGEANAGKSNVLAAIRALLDPSAPELTRADATLGGTGRIRIEARLADGTSELWLEAAPPGAVAAVRAGAPPVVFAPSELRASTLAEAAAHPDALRALALLRRGLETGARSATAPALALLDGVEACCAEELRGLLLLVEEPELFLRPQAQRSLYRTLRRFAAAGNQVVYSTHAPAFLNVSRLEELALVRQDREAGTLISQPGPLPAGEDFKVLVAFDAERSELLLARAAILVEGRTEKLTFPFVFEALGVDVDREAISIVDCAGKSNLPLFAHVCRLAGVPFVAVHDRDGHGEADRTLNGLIAAAAGGEHTFVLAPDFEAALGLHRRGHKPEHAWRRFSQSRRRVPRQLLLAAETALRLARG